MEESLNCRRASSHIQICSSNIDWGLVMCPKLEIERYFHKPHFHTQKCTPWLWKVRPRKSCKKQICHSILVPTFFIFVTFSWGGFFRATGYVFKFGAKNRIAILPIFKGNSFKTTFYAIPKHNLQSNITVIQDSRSGLLIQKWSSYTQKNSVSSRLQLLS